MSIANRYIYQNLHRYFITNQTIRHVVIILTLTILSSCGLSPLYTNAKDVRSIDIIRTDSVDFAIFYSELLRSLKDDKNARYQLKSSFKYSTSPLIMNKESDILEQSTIAFVTIEILDKYDSYNIKYSYIFPISSSYNVIPSSPYATYVSDKVTKENMLIKAATDVAMRANIFLYKNQ